MPAVSARQMSARENDLLFDLIEIIEKPGIGRRNPLAFGDSAGHYVVGGEQHLLNVGKPCQQFVRPRPEVGGLPGGQRRSMAVELFDSEELRTKQLGIRILAPIVTTEYDLRKLFESDDGLLMKPCCRPRAPTTDAAAAKQRRTTITQGNARTLRVGYEPRH